METPDKLLDIVHSVATGGNFSLILKIIVSVLTAVGAVWLALNNKKLRKEKSKKEEIKDTQKEIKKNKELDTQDKEDDESLTAEIRKMRNGDSSK